MLVKRSILLVLALPTVLLLSSLHNPYADSSFPMLMDVAAVATASPYTRTATSPAPQTFASTSTPTAIATPTTTGTATATRMPSRTRTPTLTRTRIPTPTATPVPIEVTAWVSNSLPRKGSAVTVYGKITRGGAGIAGVPMHTTWYLPCTTRQFRTRTLYCNGTSKTDGIASCSQGTDRLPRGSYTSIKVEFTYQGKVYWNRTGFTVR